MMSSAQRLRRPLARLLLVAAMAFAAPAVARADGAADATSDAKKKGDKKKGDKADGDLVLRAYKGAAAAHTDGSYFEWLQKSPIERKEIRRAVVAELETIRALAPESRLAEFNRFGRYYSAANKGYQDGALALMKAMGLDDAAVRAGVFDSATTADRLLDAIDAYDKDVTIPIARAVAGGLTTQSRYQGKPLLFLGRDFTPMYLWARGAGVPNTHLANVSRTIRDAANAGQTAELRQALADVGVPTGTDGLVVLDSGKLGRIPASVYTALTEVMTPEDAYRFLRNSATGYLESRRKGGREIARLARVSANAAGTPKRLERATLAGVLRELETDGAAKIPTFEVPADNPTLARVLDRYGSRKNKLAEWRPKLVTTSEGFATGGRGFVTRAPATPGDRVQALLGLHADLGLVRSVTAEARASGGTIPASPAATLAAQRDRDLDRAPSSARRPTARTAPARARR